MTFFRRGDKKKKKKKLIRSEHYVPLKPRNYDQEEVMGNETEGLLDPQFKGYTVEAEFQNTNSYDEKVNVPPNEEIIYHMPKKISTNPSGEIFTTDEEEKEEEEEKFKRKGLKKRRSFMITLISLTILVVLMTIFIWVLERGSAGSHIMLINGILSTILVGILIFGLVLLYTGTAISSKVIYIIAFLISLGFSLIFGLTYPTIIYRQSIEDFWVLFLASPMYIRIFLVLLLPNLIFILIAALILVCAFV